MIFTALGVSGTANSLLATGVYGIVKMVSCGLFITFLADTLGRRWSFVWTGYVMFFCMFYLGFYVLLAPPAADAPIPPAGYVALVMVYIFAAAFQFGWGPVCWIYVSEIPTNRLRGYNVALAASTQWLFNLVVARVSPVMLQNAGRDGYGTYFIFACFCFVMATLAFWVPETKGVSRRLVLFIHRTDEADGFSRRSLWSVWMNFSELPTFPAWKTWAWLPSTQIGTVMWRQLLLKRPNMNNLSNNRGHLYWEFFSIERVGLYTCS